MKIIRALLVLPAMFLGGLVAALAATIYNMPLIFIAWLDKRMGGWSLGTILLGRALSDRITDCICAVFSGIFVSVIALVFALNMFPFIRHRRGAAYLFFTLLFLNYASPHQIAIYGSRYVYGAKLLGVVIGFVGLLNLLANPEAAGLFSYVDRKLGIQASPNQGLVPTAKPNIGGDAA